MINISGKHEDLIFKNREFIQELSKVQDLYFDTLFAELVDEGLDPSLEDDLFDYIYNDTDPELFEEYLAKYNRTI